MAIFLVRHARSAGNDNEKLHGQMGDHSIPLTAKGLKQADKVGEFLQNYISLNLPPEETVRLWSSPYKRTTQTAQGLHKNAPNILWDNNKQGGHIFFDARLREREFGFYDGKNDDEIAIDYPIQWAHYQKTKADFGKYYTRPFGGESAADVSDRLATFKETLFRDINNKGIKHHVITNHGYTQRCFVNMFLHLHPHHFEAEKNPENTEVRLLDIDPMTGRYADYRTIYTPSGIELSQKPEKPKIYTLT